jgi:hypothetical protein
MSEKFAYDAVFTAVNQVTDRTGYVTTYAVDAGTGGWPGLSPLSPLPKSWPRSGLK